MRLSPRLRNGGERHTVIGRTVPLADDVDGNSAVWIDARGCRPDHSGAVRIGRDPQGTPAATKAEASSAAPGGPSVSQLGGSA